MDYDIFREEIATKYPAYGHALWKPSPGGLYHAVEVGDVGFIREGYFHRLFNILLPEGHPSHRDGVPQNHEPLELRMSSPTYAGMLQPNNLCSKGVFMDSDEYGLYALGPDSAQLSFSCTRRQGAILALPLPARYKDTAARGDFAKCITKHIDEWFAFAQECGSGISRREDIILVTGCHLAKSWANIAFQDRHEKVTFGVQVSGGHVEWQFTPEGARGVAFNLGPSGQNLLEDQCIFVRGFRVTRFMGILPRLQGAAGPARIPGDDNPDAAAQIISISVDTHYQDPLHTLLNYISTVSFSLTLCFPGV
ncbi:hypothetical protein BC826DRAFT_381343 [Russula brevipes]|nr:hypothetical protein BC826DRAFT_381343 [Russula brevipes]